MVCPQPPFDGFTPLDASFVYCPNGFLAVVIPTQARGVTRVVGYVLYQTLRWLDEQGNSNTEDIATSYSTLINEAGVSRGAIRPAIDAALAAKFIVCSTVPRVSTESETAAVGEYRIKWSEDRSNSFEDFRGFYSGDGCRSPLPHEFFTHVGASFATLRRPRHRRHTLLPA